MTESQDGFTNEIGYVGVLARTMERLHRFTNVVGYVGLLAIVLILALNVCSRKLGWPVPGAYSIVTAAAVFLAVPAIIHAYFERAHVVVGSLKGKFSPVALEILETIADIFAIGIWGCAGWGGLQYAEQMWVANEVAAPLDLPLAPFRFIWAIGLFLICFVILIDRLLKLMRKGRK
jgi:TRAP-type C4-dicarboxylate transport system permease small subunit